MFKHDLAELECRVLFEAIYQRWGYDFRQCCFASISKRIAAHAQAQGYANIAGLIPAVLHCELKFRQLLFDTLPDTANMFAEPQAIRRLSERLFPVLETYPQLNIWHAGCATGEEVYSMAILLHERGLYQRSQLYATDINDAALAQGSSGKYPVRELRESHKLYFQAGGKHSLSDYYATRQGMATINENFTQNIVFSNHNLVTDGVFAQMQLIICKNVLIYFNQVLQNRLLKLFTDSLCRNGYLCLGKNESLALTPFSDQYELIEPEYNLYKKIAF